MDGDASGGDYSEPTGAKLGALDEKLDLPHSSGLSLTNPSRDLSAGLTWSQSAGLWCFPIETLSQDTGRIQRIYQSSAIIPHWHVTPDDDGRWRVSIRWNFVQAASAAVRRAETEDRAALVPV
jgi:4-alpha-glucanotransferase